MKVQVDITFDGKYVGSLIEVVELGTDLSEMGDTLKEVLKFRQEEMIESISIVNGNLKPTAHMCEENNTQENETKWTITYDGVWYLIDGSDGIEISHCPFCGEKLEER